jgi:quercetin dioxygenase-like cupin family protein
MDAGMMTPMKTASVVALTVAIVGLTAGMYAQQAGFKRTVLQQADISMPGHEVITAVGEFQPGASPGRHTHPGEEVSYVLEGSVVLEIAGKPDKTVRAGEAFIIPAGAVHNATNKGTAVAKIVATYIVEKGKPLATPASARQ